MPVSVGHLGLAKFREPELDVTFDTKRTSERPLPYRLLLACFAVVHPRAAARKPCPVILNHP